MATWPTVTVEVGFGLNPSDIATWPIFNGDNSSFQRQIGDWITSGNASAALAPGTAPTGLRNSLGLTCTSAGDMYTYIYPDTGTVLANVSYTGSVQIKAGSTGRTVQYIWQWFDATNTMISQSTASGTDTAGSWTTINLTATAPANMSYVIVLVYVVSAAVGEQHFIADPVMDTTTSRWTNITRYVRKIGLQRSQRTYELNRFESGTASITIDNTGGRFDPTNSSGPYWPNVVPIVPIRIRATWNGITYPLWTGYVERWPQSWEDPALSLPTITCVDSMAVLSQQDLSSTYIQQVILDGPSSFYPCTESLTAAGAGNMIGTDVAPIVSSPYGTAGTVLGGTAVVYDGNSSINFNPTPAATHGDYLNLTNAPGMAPSVSTGWSVDFWAMQASATPPVPSPIFMQISATANTGYEVVISRVTLGHISLWAGGSVVYDSGSYLWFDNSPNHFAITYSTSGVTKFYVNGAQVYSGSPSLGAPPFATVFGGDWLAATGVGYNYQGYGGMIAFYNYELSAGQVNAHYAVGEFGGYTESTGARAARILSYANWPNTLRSIQTGNSTAGSNGGIGLSGLGGSSVLSALQDDADAEGGQLYAAADATMIFEARNFRTSQTAPINIWDPTGGLPYQLSSLAADYDPTYVYNTVALTRDGGPTQTVTDKPSAKKYLPRTYTATLKVLYDSDVGGRANLILSRSKDPHIRFAAFEFIPSANPTVLFPIALGMDISDWQQLTHRPIGAPAISFNGYVDSLFQEIVVEDGSQSWTVQILLSPQITQYWQLAAFHTTVHSNASSGATTLTLDAFGDATTNIASASMTTGTYQVIRSGAFIGSITVTAIGTTTLGYTTFTVTTTATGFSINSGDVICSPLPPGITDPTRWNIRSVLGSTTILAD